ncbi:phage portal protein [Amorphus orientalis]|uniref:Lambda family phage portal protein n=1 Tax=Amorphus orientalis TaxID=649198 RepID=A0AAE4AUS0_9HYPH|nr:phage portal protein [Amorphus orientalis]MDQ0317715.1 lambda family phage portal protein [Amorphus orientalis]
MGEDLETNSPGEPNPENAPASADHSPVLPADAGAPDAVVGGAYESASLFDRGLALWSPSMGSADFDILDDKEVLDARSRDAIRNDAYTRAGADIRKDNIVGSLYMLNAKPNAEVLGLDEVWAEEFQQEVEAKFTLWAESINNWVDASRRNNFTDLVRLAVGLDMMAGEVLAVGEWEKDQPRPFKTAVQMVDTDRLSTPPTVFSNDNVRGGIRRNRKGQPVGYYIRKAHPTDHRTRLEAHQWRYVPTRKPWGRQQVIHIYETFRPDQSRGVAAMVSALKETRIAKKFRDVMLQNAVVNATYAATIESDLDTEKVFEALGGGRGGDDWPKQFNKYAGGYLGALSKYMENAKNADLNGVRIPHLFPGSKLRLQPAGQGGPLGTEFEASLLRYLAANLGVSYEQLSRDFSKTNYSSMKGALNETEKGMRARKRSTADRFATHIFWMWLEEAIAFGEIFSLPRRAPNYWDGLNREAYGACEWIGASRGQIDELKETQAAVLRMRAGLSTREEEHARLGKDWRRVLSQLAREKKEIERLGLNLDEKSNMMNAASGAPRDQEEDAA